jgi:hypothetical protein
MCASAAAWPRRRRAGAAARRPGSPRRCARRPAPSPPAGHRRGGQVVWPSGRQGGPRPARQGPQRARRRVARGTQPPLPLPSPPPTHPTFLQLPSPCSATRAPSLPSSSSAQAEELPGASCCSQRARQSSGRLWPSRSCATRAHCRAGGGGGGQARGLSAVSKGSWRGASWGWCTGRRARAFALATERHQLGNR